MQAMFERKPSDFRPQEFVVDKTIRLSADVFESVLKAPMREYDFIRENTDLMYCDENHVFHCLLLTGEGRNDGLLVEAEGAAYCRYASYVPEVSALTSHALWKLNQCMTGAVEYIVSTGTQQTTQGNWNIDFKELALETGFEHDFNSMDTLLRMLREHEAVADVELIDEGIDVCFYLDFCPNYEQHPEETVPEPAPAPAAPATTLRNLLRTRWEDIHLLHKDVEIEVPHTIVELDEHTLTEAGQEAWADVLSAEVVRIYSGYYGVQLELDKVKPRRLEEFSAMLAGYCSVQDYEKWVTEEAEAPVQSPEIKM